MFPGMKLRHLLPKIRPQDLVIYIQGKRVLLDRQAKSPKARNEQNTDEEMTPFRRDTSLPSRFLHKALLSRVYWFPMAAETSHHKNRDLKQRCIIWQFQRPEVNPGLTGLNSGVSRAVFLPKAPGNSLSSCLFQFLEPAQIPWLVAPSSSFKDGNVSGVLLIGHHSDTDSGPPFHFQGPWDDMVLLDNPGQSPHLRVTRLATLIPSATLIPVAT